ncbi:glycosyltransferase family 2 protein [Nocardioides zhouii]|nr:glycosyltransferase family 2 protein [Nocardioides zhouii]
MLRALRSREVRLARKGFVDIDLPRASRVPGSFWAVMMVKNEADVIESTVNHLLSQGAAGILVADNLSTDATLDLLRSLAERDNRVHVARDLEPGYYQSAKMSYLARRAWKAGADWIVPVDADEHWFAPKFSLADYFRRSDAPRAWAAMHEAYPENADARWEPMGLIQVERDPGPLPKVAFKAAPWTWIGDGNHSLRGVPPSRQADLKLLHYQYRSQAQFSSKVQGGVAALNRAVGQNPEMGQHWREQAAMSETARGDRWRDLVESRIEDHGQRRRASRVLVRAPGAWATWDPSGEIGV